MIALLRIGSEVALKSRRVRAEFQRKLKKNIETALAGKNYRLTTEWSRFFLEIEYAEHLETLSRVSGLDSFSVVDTTCVPEMQAMVETGFDFYREKLAGKSFAVRAKRRYKHAFTSKQVEIELGERLLPCAQRVDLTRPDVTINIEIRKQQALFFTSRGKGIGGLPVGTGGRAVSLISGGFDSAVASFLMYNRGLDLDFVFCNLHGGRAYELSVLRIIAALHRNYGYSGNDTSVAFCIDFSPVIKDLKTKVAGKYWQVILKRLLYRSAEIIARKRGAKAIVTGESIGQVSSQTLANLAAIEPAISLLVLRPLLGHNKDQIIAWAHKIKTYDLCAHIREYCQLTEDKPVTNMNRARAAKEEHKLELHLLAAQTQQARKIPLTKISTLDLVTDYLYTKTIPSGAVVIDCRPQAEYDKWHHPEAIHRDFHELLANCHCLPEDPTYVLHCAAGVQSTLIAERMQKLGYEAYSLSP